MRTEEQPSWPAPSAGEPSAVRHRGTGLDGSQRMGIFSMPAVLASHSGPVGTRLIKRGAFWVRKVMCQEMEPPPPGLDLTLYEGGGKSVREKIEATTNQAACIGCHKIINPFAFFQENYDALGRWRRLDDNGVKVNASIKLNFLDDSSIQKSEAKGPIDALKALTGSMTFQQCFVRQMFRFYMGRDEEPSDDPTLGQMLVGFIQNDQQDILELLTTLAQSDRMDRRQ